MTSARAADAGIASGNLPDVAGCPAPASCRSGTTRACSSRSTSSISRHTRARQPPGIAELGRSPDGKLVGIFTKGAVKGLIWYDTKIYDGTVPATWNDLKTKRHGPAPATPRWCIGLESGGDSGWPGTDWIEDIVLRQTGPDVYDAGSPASLKWTSPEIKSAFESSARSSHNAYGGPTTSTTRTSARPANRLFTDPPGCMFHHQASFITHFFQNEAGRKPTLTTTSSRSLTSTRLRRRASTGAGDLFGMFNDTPQARALIQYLLTPEAQAIWAERAASSRPTRTCPLDAYPDDALASSAEILANAQDLPVRRVRPHARAMNAAFFDGDRRLRRRTQSTLDTILAKLDEVQATAYERLSTDAMVAGGVIRSATPVSRGLDDAR